MTIPLLPGVVLVVLVVLVFLALRTPTPTPIINNSGTVHNETNLYIRGPL